MRVVQVVTLVSDDGTFGGPPSVAIAQLQEMAERGHDVRLVSLWRGGVPAPPRIGAVPFVSRRARTVVPGQGCLGLMHPLLLWDLWRAMGRADAVHLHVGRDLVSLAALAVARLRRADFVVQTHGMVEPRTGKVARVFDSVYVPSLRRARCCLVLTERERRALTAVLGTAQPPLVTLANGMRRSSEARHERERDAREVIFLARLHPRKRPEAFVEMAALVHKEIPEARFTLYGADEGSLGQVKQLVADRGLTDVVRYGGPLAHSAALAAYRRAGVYVLPSVNEPFPMTVLEALAEGTPVVCTSSCGIAKELAGRQAALVTDGSPEALAEAVGRLLTDEGLRRRLVDAGHRAVEEVFSIRAVVDRLETIYRDRSRGRDASRRAMPSR
ncbi:glycosyltransferase involved in cell wall biosynthesis [Streptomyces puniciscabiei]|uniref:D-inositol 3-phosphate glycosyltransferase n=1 Tax=Streptomyces puniciscabiei TaxID=164348 RepID=A0A542UIM9_9ACTN|nr:glycosyltransferase [Streptomyces puniciscabiei]TQK98940.1 glycosyltransferase involved in cell wall biosynthesis [Streptomyces puniciscabiei]